jgi:hypothetical protein
VEAIVEFGEVVCCLILIYNRNKLNKLDVK